MSRRSRRAVYPTMGEAITFSLPVSIDLTRKDRVLTVEASWPRRRHITGYVHHLDAALITAADRVAERIDAFLDVIFSEPR